MPIFEYECLECHEVFERLERSADPQASCPVCGTESVQRRVSLCAVSSEGIREANLSAAHRSAAAKREDKHRSEHALQHDHFGDTAKPEGD